MQKSLLNIYRVILLGSLAVAMAQTAEAASAAPSAPRYECMVDTELIPVTLSENALTNFGEPYQTGRFVVTKSGDKDLLLKVEVNLNLFNQGIVQALELRAQQGSWLYVDKSRNSQSTGILNVGVVQKDGKEVRPTEMSIQCKVEGFWSLEPELTEGKIEATMRNSGNEKP